MQLNEEQTAAVEHPIGAPACLIAGAGSGKCLGPDVPVIMFDGSMKRARDIKNGDLLLGPDGTPRKVSGTTSGVDDMYGPDCTCRLCTKYGWHDSAPFWAKCVEFLRRYAKGLRVFSNIVAERSK